MFLRLAVFDFDLTLSSVHVFNTLAGGNVSHGFAIPPPYAKTERGQLALLADIDARPEYRSQGGFALGSFGGEERVGHIAALLDEFGRTGIECIICTRGLVGPVRKCLEKLGLTRYFTKVYGNIGATYGATEYDLRLPPASGNDSRFLGGPELAGWGSKQQLISRCMRERNLSASDALFIDDDPSEVKSLLGVCVTVQVQSTRGIAQWEFDSLRAWASNNLTLNSSLSAHPISTSPSTTLLPVPTETSLRSVPVSNGSAGTLDTPPATPRAEAPRRRHSNSSGTAVVRLKPKTQSGQSLPVGSLLQPKHRAPSPTRSSRGGSTTPVLPPTALLERSPTGRILAATVTRTEPSDVLRLRHTRPQGGDPKECAPTSPAAEKQAKSMSPRRRPSGSKPWDSNTFSDEIFISSPGPRKHGDQIIANTDWQATDADDDSPLFDETPEYLPRPARPRPTPAYEPPFMQAACGLYELKSLLVDLVAGLSASGGVRSLPHNQPEKKQGRNSSVGGHHRGLPETQPQPRRQQGTRSSSFVR